MFDQNGIEWRLIPDLDGKYYASEYGDIMNINTGHILKDRIDWAGYRELQLWIDGGKKTFKIHRLVAMAFIPNPYNLPFVLHWDNNKLNCHYTNLRWGTASENVQQAFDDGIKHNPDVRKYYKVTNPYTGEEEYILGRKAVAEYIGYDKSIDGLFSRLRYENPRVITKGPGKGWKIERLDLTRVFDYLGPIGYNLPKYKKE